MVEVICPQSLNCEKAWKVDCHHAKKHYWKGSMLDANYCGEQISAITDPCPACVRIEEVEKEELFTEEEFQL